MKTTDEIRALKERIAELEKEVKELKAQRPEYHYHFHPAPLPAANPIPIPYAPSITPWIHPVTCGGTGPGAQWIGDNTSGVN